jgi:hypothetical protein
MIIQGPKVQDGKTAQMPRGDMTSTSHLCSSMLLASLLEDVPQTLE